MAAYNQAGRGVSEERSKVRGKVVALYLAVALPWWHLTNRDNKSDGSGFKSESPWESYITVSKWLNLFEFSVLWKWRYFSREVFVRLKQYNACLFLLRERRCGKRKGRVKILQEAHVWGLPSCDMECPCDIFQSIDGLGTISWVFETSLEHIALSSREGGEMLVRNGDGQNYLLAIQWPLENTIIVSH